MPITIKQYNLGPLETNSFLIADTAQKTGILIDPAEGSHLMLEEARENGWQIQKILITHAHFDHLTGIPELAKFMDPMPSIHIHKLDLELYIHKGGAELFGLSIDLLPDAIPDIEESVFSSLF